MNPDDVYDDILYAYIGWTRTGAEGHIYNDPDFTEETENTILDILDSLSAELDPIDELLGAIEGLAQAVFAKLEASA